MAPKATFMLSESPCWPNFPLSSFSIGAQRIMASTGSLTTPVAIRLFALLIVVQEVVPSINMM